MKYLGRQLRHKSRPGRRNASVRVLLLTLICVGGGLWAARVGPPATQAGGVTSANLSLSKSADESAALGSNITYSINVTNAGPDDALNATVTDPLPAHTTFVSATVSQGTVAFAGNTLTANLGTLIVGDSANVMLVVSVNGDTPRGTTISNTATVSAGTTDPDPADNSASAFTLVTGPFPGDVLISEFRFRGPVASGTPFNGARDEFVELYNNTDADIGVFAGDGSSGWAVVASDGATRFVIPAGTTLPARGHYLAVNSGYSLSNYPASDGTTATGDVTYSTDIPDNAGIALFSTSAPPNFNLANRLDAVGFSAAPALYREGNGLPNPVVSDIQHSFVRQLTTGLPQDTDNNAQDFALVATNGNQTLTTAQLGAPGPENLSSPIQRNAQLKPELIDPQNPSSCDTPQLACARVRDPNATGPNAALGTLDLRRRFSNGTDLPLTRLRFRVVDITTLGSPGAGASQADLRVLSSSDIIVTLSGGPRLVVSGLTREEPPVQTSNGGGLNTSLSVGFITLAQPLAPGNSVDVHFLLGVQQSGNYRFFVNVEAATAPPPDPGKPGRGRKLRTAHKLGR